MKTIDALSRGLDVLRGLEERRGQSLAELHRATGIPKASLLRILETLEQSGFAWRAIGDGRYRRAAGALKNERRRHSGIIWKRKGKEGLSRGAAGAGVAAETRAMLSWPAIL